MIEAFSIADNTGVVVMSDNGPFIQYVDKSGPIRRACVAPEGRSTGTGLKTFPLAHQYFAAKITK